MIQSVKGNGRGPSGPPDLFEIMKKFRGGGSPGRRFGGFIGVVVLILLVWAALTSFYTVQPEQRAVVKRFGSVMGITDPGLHFKLPFGIDQIQLVATERVLKQEFGFRTQGTRQGQRSTYSDAQFEDESLMLTGDLNMIDVEWVCLLYTSDAADE